MILIRIRSFSIVLKDGHCDRLGGRTSVLGPSDQDFVLAGWNFLDFIIWPVIFRRSVR
jgi:hypothetical protein